MTGTATASLPAQSLKRVVAQPVITRLDIFGNTSISTEELKAAIVTESSHFRNFFGLPLVFIPRKTLTLDRAELDRDLLRLRVLYWKRGWRAAQVLPEIEKLDEGKVSVRLRVVEGPPTRIGSLNFGPIDSLLDEHGLRSLISVAPGQVLDLIKLDSISGRLAAHLDAEGYGDVTVTPVAVADTSSPLATVRFDVKRLYQTRVESVRVEGTESYDPRLVANTMRIKAGETYSRTAVVQSQRALYEAGFFKRAFVRVDDGTTDSLKKLVAMVEELPVHSFRTTGGFSTTDFFQFDARYVNANFRGNAGRLSLQATVGNLLGSQLSGKFIFNSVLPASLSDSAPKYLQPTFQVNAEVRRRWLSDYRNQSGLSMFAYRRSSPGVFVDQGGGVAASFTRNVTRAVPISAQYRIEFTDVSAADAYYCVNFGVCDDPSLAVLRRAQRLAPLVLSAASDLRDDPIGPTRGYTWRTEFEFADAWTGSQLRYGRVEVEGSSYLHVSDRLTVAFHARAGYVRGRGGASIHPRKRFYAGGARSVRGYGENQLGPRILVIPRAVFQPDSTAFLALVASGASLPCDPGTPLPQCATDSLLVNDRWTSTFSDGDFTPKPLGAETLAEGSVEARYRLSELFTLAAFLDAGSLGTTITGTTTVVTPGLGVRFLSPVGPIRVDVGYNPRSQDQLRVVTELAPRDEWWQTVGIPRTSGLYQIDTRRAFNPATGTGLGGAFNRITIHLSIGEAF